MAKTQCSRCGAPVESLVCRYCGGLAGTAEGLEGERKALRELHDFLVKAEKDAQMKMLRGGYLPSHPDVLIDAGLRCVPILGDTGNDPEVCMSAVARLESIVMKLKLMPRDERIGRAIAEFEGKLKAERAEENQAVLIFFGVLVVVAAVLVWLVMRIFK